MSMRRERQTDRKLLGDKEEHRERRKRRKVGRHRNTGEEIYRDIVIETEGQLKKRKRQKYRKPLKKWTK
jgi:hypothetical protein